MSFCTKWCNPYHVSYTIRVAPEASGITSCRLERVRGVEHAQQRHLSRLRAFQSALKFLYVACACAFVCMVMCLALSVPMSQSVVVYLAVASFTCLGAGWVRATWYQKALSDLNLTQCYLEYLQQSEEDKAALAQARTTLTRFQRYEAEREEAYLEYLRTYMETHYA
jgi:hypothetical protein